jgi:hypothetical protein
VSKRIYAALVSLAAVAALSFAGPAEAAGRCDGHQCQHGAARRAHKRARAARQRAHRRSGRTAVAYVCPMHPDIRERSRGTCPKCLMDLVAEPRGAKPGARAAGAGVSASGGM